MFTYHPTVSRVAGRDDAFRPAVLMRNSSGKMCGWKVSGDICEGIGAKEEARNIARTACQIAVADLRLSLPGFRVGVV
jgi:hypothetical protein